jgi:hypothetical protein
MVKRQHLLFGKFLGVIWLNSSYNRFANGMSTKLPISSIGIRQQTEIVTKSTSFDRTANNVLSRRSMILIISSLSSIVPDLAKAREDSLLATSVNNTDKDIIIRPFAPNAALLPAARLKLVVDNMYTLSTTLKSTTSDKEQE